MLAFLAACGTLETYPGPERPDSEIAILEGYWHYLFIYTEQIGISAVDGRRASNFSRYVDSVRLLPGRHWIELIVARNYGSVARCSYEYEFDAQSHYRMKTLSVKGLLAHPLSSPYRGSISIEVAAPGRSVQVVSVAAVCTSGELLCRQDSDCPANYPCHTDPDFAFGTCKPRDH